MGQVTSKNAMLMTIGIMAAVTIALLIGIIGITFVGIKELHDDDAGNKQVQKAYIQEDPCSVIELSNPGLPYIHPDVTDPSVCDLKYPIIPLYREKINQLSAHLACLGNSDCARRFARDATNTLCSADNSTDISKGEYKLIRDRDGCGGFTGIKFEDGGKTKYTHYNSDGTSELKNLVIEPDTFLQSDLLKPDPSTYDVDCGT